MNCALNLLAAPAARAKLEGLSDWELIQQFPALRAVSAGLWALGFLSAGYLWWRHVATRRMAGHSPARALALTPTAGAGRGLQLAAIGLLAAMLSDLLLGAAAIHTGTVDSSPLLLGVSVMRLTILGAVLVALRASGAGRPAVAPPVHPVRAAAIGALFYLAAVPVVDVLLLLTGTLLHTVGYELTPQPLVAELIHSPARDIVGLVMFLAVIVAPLFEEVLFRGLAYPALKQRWGALPALLIVSACFAVSHLHLPALVPLFALGIGLGLAYEVSGSLVAPIAMHALFNAVNVGMLLYIRWHV